MRQRRDLVARTAARRDPPAARHRHRARGNEVKVGPIENLAVQPGDLVSLPIGPRDGNHSCDLTAVELRSSTKPMASEGVESGRRRFGRRAGRQSACRPLRQRRRLAFLHRTRQGRRFGVRDSRRFAAGEVASRRRAPTKSRSWPTVANAPDFTRRRLKRRVPMRCSIGSLRRSAGRSSGAGTPPDDRCRCRNADNAPASDEPHGASIRAVREASKRPGDRRGKPLCAGARRSSRCACRPTWSRAANSSRPRARRRNGRAGQRAGVCLDDARRTSARRHRPTCRSSPWTGSPARQRIEAAFDDFRGVFPAALCYTRSCRSTKS